MAACFWRCVSDGSWAAPRSARSRVAPSDPNVIYAGTGETAIRLDVSYGDGMYKSSDAGRTWSHVGLRNSKFIGRICIHPTNPDLIYAAVLGDVFGPNSERGVYRSKDGGKSWEKILYRSDVAGAIELTMDRTNPRLLFASMWEARRNFLEHIEAGGPGSGLFRSTDGGDTWEEITRKPGLPDGMIGKIGVTISPARAGRVWALIEAEGGQDRPPTVRTIYGLRWDHGVAQSRPDASALVLTRMSSPTRATPTRFTSPICRCGNRPTAARPSTRSRPATATTMICGSTPATHADDRGQRRRRPCVVQHRRFVVDDLQPEDRAVLARQRVWGWR